MWWSLPPITMPSTGTLFSGRPGESSTRATACPAARTSSTCNGWLPLHRLAASGPSAHRGCPLREVTGDDRHLRKSRRGRVQRDVATEGDIVPDGGHQDEGHQLTGRAIVSDGRLKVHAGLPRDTLVRGDRRASAHGGTRTDLHVGANPC